MVPDWAHDGGVAPLKEALASEDARKRLRQEMQPRGPILDNVWLTYFKRPQNHVYEGLSVEANCSPARPAPRRCDMRSAARRRLADLLCSDGANGNTLPAFVSHPLSMVGSDAVLLGDFPSPRTYGCFPVILAEYVREENQMALPEAIRKMTSFPAQRLGLSDRGILRDGMKADITIFIPTMCKRLPRRTEPKQFPIGHRICHR